MTREEAITFMDELKVCIKEHPIVADWLVEIADRKTEPTISKMEQVDKDINVRSKTEPQYDFGDYADRLWKIAYERGKREALEQTEPSCETCKLKDTTEWCKRQEVCRAYQPKDDPQTCSVNGRPYSECGRCEHFKCTADEPQTERGNE